LSDTVSVSEVDEKESTHISFVLNPSAECDGLSGMIFGELSTGMCAMHEENQKLKAESETSGCLLVFL